NTDRKATVGVYDINLATSTAKRLVSAKDGDSFNPNTGITTYDAVYQPAGITADPTTTGAFYFSDLGLPRYPTDYGYGNRTNALRYPAADLTPQVDSGRVYHYDPVSGKYAFVSGMPRLNNQLYGTNAIFATANTVYTANQGDGGGNPHLLGDPDFTYSDTHFD